MVERRKWIRVSRSLAIVLISASLVLASLGTAGANDQAVADGLKLVATIPYLDGTHMEHATIRGRDYAFTATQDMEVADLRVIDVTNPERPAVVAKIPCGSFQGNIQISADRKTLILGVDGLTMDGTCVKQQDEGFVTVDISNPRKPKPVGFASIAGGSHSTAAHPTKPIVYNAPEGFVLPDRRPPVLEIFSIANPAKPKLLNTIALSGAHSPHDISFNKDGSMAALANISAFHILDTRNPAKPVVETTSQCPGCQHTHEARFTPDSKTLVVNDESMAGPYPCPGGALYFYEVGGTRGSRSVELTGAYAPSSLGLNAANEAGFCTPHVFDISSDGSKVAASWHTGGLRYIDITKRTGAAFGTAASTSEAGPREVGAYTAPGADFFTAKLYEGPYIYTHDLNAGFQVFRVLSASARD